MKIGMVLDKWFPPDIRVEKEARLLKTYGHHDYVLSKALAGRPEQEDKEGVVIRRISLQKSVSYLGRKLNSLRFFLFFQNEFWGKEMRKFIDDFQLDVCTSMTYRWLGRD